MGAFVERTNCGRAAAEKLIGFCLPLVHAKVANTRQRARISPVFPPLVVQARL